MYDNLIKVDNFQLKCVNETYRPLCMGFKRIRMYLKSGLVSGLSCQQSCIHLTMKSSHLSNDISGLNGAYG